jgi:hypothetical protein
MRSPHGAQRNAGTAAPDFAALHPGYDAVAIYRSTITLAPTLTLL